MLSGQAHPDIKVIHRWPPPISVKELTAANKTCVVSLDWIWFPLIGISPDGTTEGPTSSAAMAPTIDAPAAVKQTNTPNQKDITVFPILARAWGKHVQLATCYESPVIADPATTASSNAPAVTGEVKFFQYSGRSVDDSILMAKWLCVDEMRLVLITATHVLIIDGASANLEIQETVSLAPSLSTALLEMVVGRPADSGILTCSCSSNDSLFILSPTALSTFTLQNWVEQTNLMIKDGKWLDALAKVLQEHKHRFSGGSTTDEHSQHISPADTLLMMGPEEDYLDARTLKENETIDGYLKKYLDLAVSRQASSYTSSASNLGIAGHQGSSSFRNQHQLVAGVCIEYCVAANRMKFLFADVFTVFVACRQESHYLDALEPFILNRRIRWLPPKIIGSLFELSARSHRLPALERIIVHLDLFHDVDIHFVIKFLHANKLNSAYLYAYTNGLGDSAGAFHSLFTARLLYSARSPSSDNEFPSSEQAEVGYRLLLFIEYVANGNVYPRGSKIEPAPSVDVLWRLLDLLVSYSYVSHSSVSFGEQKSNSLEPNVYSLASEKFPFLYALYKVDVDALFYCISHGLTVLAATSEPRLKESASKSKLIDSTASGAVEAPVFECSTAFILERTYQFVCHLSDNFGIKYESTDRPFFEQCLKNIVNCRELLSADILENAIKYINTHVKPRVSAEELAIKLAISQSRLYTPSHLQEGTLGDTPPRTRNGSTFPPLRGILEESKFYRAAVRISFWKHRLGGGSIVFGAGLRYYLTLSSRSNGSAVSAATNLKLSNLSSNEGMGSQLEQPFLYVADQFSVLNREAEDPSVMLTYALVLIAVLPELFELDRELTRTICKNYLCPYISEMCEHLKKYPSLLFDILYSIFSTISSTEESVTPGRRGSQFSTEEVQPRGGSTVTTVDNAIPKGEKGSYFTQSTMLTFLKLVATLQPRSLYNILSTSDNYSVDEALIIARDRRVFDATSYLLERIGDYNAALDVTLAEFSSSFGKLYAELSTLLYRTVHSNTLSSPEFNLFKKGLSVALRAYNTSIANSAATQSTAVMSAGQKQTGNKKTEGGVRENMHEAIFNNIELFELTTNLQPYHDVVYALDFTIRLCSSHSSKSESGIWFKSLDYVLSERGI